MTPAALSDTNLNPALKTMKYPTPQVVEQSGEATLKTGGAKVCAPKALRAEFLRPPTNKHPGCMPLAGDQGLAFWVLLPPVNTPHPLSSGVAECPHILPRDPRTSPPEANHCQKTHSTEKQRCLMWPSISPKQGHPKVSICIRAEPTLPQTPAAKATQLQTCRHWLQPNKYHEDYTAVLMQNTNQSTLPNWHYETHLQEQVFSY